MYSKQALSTSYVKDEKGRTCIVEFCKVMDGKTVRYENIFKGYLDVPKKK